MPSPVGSWIWHVAVLKGLKNAVKVGVAWLAAHGLRQTGITIDELQLTVFLTGLLEVGRNWLKQTQGWKFL